MDPVGVVGLQCCRPGAYACQTYIDEVKHGKEAAAEFMKELGVLHFNLSRLDQILKSEDEAARHFDDTSVLVSSTHACRNKLKLLYNKLDGDGRSRMSRLKWPLECKGAP